MAAGGPTYWEVFAARADGGPIRHVGTVRAAGAKDAAVFAHAMYDEFPWREMFVVERDRIVPVIGPR